MAELATAVKVLTAISAVASAGAEDEMRKLTRQTASWKNEAAIAGTTAAAERVVTRARQKSRLMTCQLFAATATTANGTNYLTVIVRKRTAATPGTQVALITFAMDTPTTDDLAAFTVKDLLTYQDGTNAAFDLEEGDLITVEITKTGGSGLAYPIADLSVTLEPRS